jgi:hypothetical protein
MILTHGALRALTATSLVCLVNGAIANIPCIFIPDIADSREYETLRSIYLSHIILLRYSLILNKMLMLCLEAAAPTDLTRGIE